MKKLLALIIATALILSLAGCGEKKKESKAPPKNEVTEPQTLDEVLAAIDEDFAATSAKLTEESQKLTTSVGDSFEDYQKNYGKIMAWYKLVESESEKLYERTNKNVDKYYEIMEKNVDISNFEVLNMALSDFGSCKMAFYDFEEAIYDNAFNLIEATYYDGILKDARISLDYSDWKAECSAFEDDWEAERLAFKDSWDDALSAITEKHEETTIKFYAKHLGKEDTSTTATPIDPFYVGYADDENIVPYIVDTGTKMLWISGEKDSDGDICIDTKEKALKYFKDAKKIKATKVVFLIPSVPGTLQGPSYTIDEVIEGYENGTWTFANAVEDFENQEKRSAEREAEKKAKEEAEKGYKPGTINGNVYESKYLGIGIKLSDGWSFSQGPESGDKDTLREVIAKSNTDEIIQIHILKDTEETASMTEEVNIISYKKSFEKSLSSEFDSVLITLSDVHCATRVRKALSITCEKDGKYTYMKFFTLDCFNRTANILISSTADNDFTDILNMFYSYRGE